MHSQFTYCTKRDNIEGPKCTALSPSPMIPDFYHIPIFLNTTAVCVQTPNFSKGKERTGPIERTNERTNEHTVFVIKIGTHLKKNQILQILIKICKFCRAGGRFAKNRL